MNKAQLIELLKDYPDDTQIRAGGLGNEASLSFRIIKGRVIGPLKNRVFLDYKDWNQVFDNDYDFILIRGS
jgi:hypothetical protein